MTVLKSDIINDAYSLIRISGVTVQPSAEDNELALGRLEGLAAEWASRGYDVGYKFSDVPDTGDPSGVDIAYKFAFSSGLALRVLTDFGKDIPPSLYASHGGAFSALAGATAITRPTAYPARMPRGSGNRYWGYVQVDDAPIAPDVKYIRVGGIAAYSESYKAYLNDGEIIDSVVLSADAGLTILAQALNTDANILTYSIQAGTTQGLQEIKITALTDAGRIEIRNSRFQVSA